jgi:hypothetical protein
MSPDTEINTMTHNFNHPKRYLLIFVICLFANFNHAALAEQPPVVVKTYGQHVGGNIVYQQQVTNNGSRDVVGIAIGEDTDNIGSDPDTSTRDSGELNFVMPVGYGIGKQEVNPASISGPTGWTAEIIQIQDSGLYLQWDSPGYPQPDIQPGQTFRFSVTVPGKIDDAYLIRHFSVRLSDISGAPSGDAYLTGHFSAGYADGKSPWYYNGIMEKVDITPPMLTVTLSPATIWPPNNKQVSVTATITVKDDYDPEPEIKLESITASETLAADDIQGAQFGTDDRSFSLAAKRAGTNPAGRIYTITYSDTDASGNKATASATVIVPHDQGK